MEVGKKEKKESAYRANEPEEVRVLSARSGIWLQDQLRKKMRMQIIATVKARLGEARAEMLASKLDASWCESMSKNGGVSESFFHRAEAVMNAFRLLLPENEDSCQVPLPIETREARAQRIAAKRPAPFMAWPDWAAKPWSRTDPRRKRGDEEDEESHRVLEGQAKKWRRLDERARKPTFPCGIAVTEAEVEAAQASAAALIASRRASALAHSRGNLSETNDDVLGDIESLLEDEDRCKQHTTIDLSTFLEEAVKYRAPTFFAPSSPKVLQDISLEDDEALSELIKPPTAPSYLHGQIKYCTGRPNLHVIRLLRAIAVIHGEIHVLYDCKLRLPFYFGDDHKTERKDIRLQANGKRIALLSEKNTNHQHASSLLHKLSILSFHQIAESILKEDPASAAVSSRTDLHPTADTTLEQVLYAPDSSDDSDGNDSSDEGDARERTLRQDDQDNRNTQLNCDEDDDDDWDIIYRDQDAEEENDFPNEIINSSVGSALAIRS